MGCAVDRSVERHGRDDALDDHAWIDVRAHCSATSAAYASAMRRVSAPGIPPPIATSSTSTRGAIAAQRTGQKRLVGGDQLRVSERAFECFDRESARQIENGRSRDAGKRRAGQRRCQQHAIGPDEQIARCGLRTVTFGVEEQRFVRARLVRLNPSHYRIAICERLQPRRHRTLVPSSGCDGCRQSDFVHLRGKRRKGLTATMTVG
jgi:hypothetical protein